VFSCRRLASIHAATSSTHADRRTWKSATTDGLHEPWAYRPTWVSSVYRMMKPCRSTRPTKSAVYRINRIEPNTDPCGTPHVSHVRGTCVCHVERTGIACTSKTGTTPAQGYQVHRTPADDDRVWHGRQYQMQLKGPKNQCCNVTTVDGPKNVRKCPQGSGFRRVSGQA